MAWQRKERIGTLNTLQQEIQEKGAISYNDGLRFIMNLHMLSRLTAERYLQDLIFQGKLILEKDQLKKPGLTKGSNQNAERKK
jgi:hypothetical protein